MVAPEEQPAPEQPDKGHKYMDSSNPQLRKEERAHERANKHTWKDVLKDLREPAPVQGGTSEPKPLPPIKDMESSPAIAKAVHSEVSWTERLARIRAGTL